MLVRYDVVLIIKCLDGIQLKFTIQKWVLLFFSVATSADHEPAFAFVMFIKFFYIFPSPTKTTYPFFTTSNLSSKSSATK